MSDDKGFQRWYERQPKLSQAVKLMIILPDEVRSIIGEATMMMASREFEAAKYAKTGRSLGGDKVMGLYKSKNKRREYDDNETLHQAMNYLYILSEENQDFMANHILKILEYIQQYFALCRDFNAEPSLEDVAMFTKRYVISGSANVERFLKNLKDEFYNTMVRNGQSLAAPPTVNPLEVLAAQDDRSGLRIKKQDAS